MKVAGIISEYNPFHKGHQYHIETTRKITGADCIVAVMSGNFVQRGFPAIADKFTRAKAAVLGGADLVIELPAVFATGSAEIFAEGAVRLFDALNNVDYLSFGSEAGRLDEFKKIADVLIDEPEEYRNILQQHLKSGDSMPVARAKALKEHFDNNNITEIISSPNNILSIEYIKALKKINSGITPVTVARVGNGYNDAEATTEFPSATAIRNLYTEGSDNIADAMPEAVYEYFNTVEGMVMPVFADSCSALLNHALRLNSSNLDIFSDIDEKLANRIMNILTDGNIYSFTELCDALKTKNYTYTRISRALIHILLNIRPEDIKIPQYARILACNETGRKFIRESKKTSLIPFLNDTSDTKNVLSETAKSMLEKDIYASDIYRLIVKETFGTVITDEFRHRPELV
jgi:predicted nucleotidyltransferase